MKLLFYVIHPAHYHLFKNTIKKLKKKNFSVQIMIRDKDILSELIEDSNYILIKSLKVKKNKLLKIIDLIFRTINIFNIILKDKPDIICSCSSEMVYIGRILHIPSFFFDEDDLDLDPVKLLANFTFPFSQYIFMPEECRTGRWDKKVIKYSGYHELAYLHPKNFSPNKKKIKPLLANDKYFLLRFSGFNAYHDTGINGISFNLAERIIDILEKHGDVFITSEKKLSANLEKYRISIDTKDIHDALYYSYLFIGDSQTMAVEASVLGVPNIRFNGFACKTNVSVLEELEHKYNLTYGINNRNEGLLLNKINELINLPNINEIWNVRRKKLLDKKIDVAEFMVWFIENYPESIGMMKKNQ